MIEIKFTTERLPLEDQITRTLHASLEGFIVRPVDWSVLTEMQALLMGQLRALNIPANVTVSGPDDNLTIHIIT